MAKPRRFLEEEKKFKLYNIWINSEVFMFYFICFPVCIHSLNKCLFSTGHLLWLLFEMSLTKLH